MENEKDKFHQIHHFAEVWPQVCMCQCVKPVCVEEKERNGESSDEACFREKPPRFPGEQQMDVKLPFVPSEPLKFHPIPSSESRGNIRRNMNFLKNCLIIALLQWPLSQHCSHATQNLCHIAGASETCLIKYINLEMYLRLDLYMTRFLSCDSSSSFLPIKNLLWIFPPKFWGTQPPLVPY